MSLDWTKIAQGASRLRIQWMHNFPMVALWVGWWEQMIQMIKKLLRRVLGRTSLKNEELLTVLCITEAVIKSRLLTCLSEDSNDVSHITPSYVHSRCSVCGCI